MSKMAQFAYIYGIASPSPSWRMPPRGSGAGGNFSAEYSAVLHNDGDGGCSLPKSVDTGQIGFIDDIECKQQAASLWRTNDTLLDSW